MAQQKYTAGDIVLVDFNNSVGHQQSGIRPALIVSNNIGNEVSSMLCVLPFTKQLHKKPLPTHVYFKASKTSGLKYDSILLGEAITNINKFQVVSYLGKFNDYEMSKASIAMANHIAPLFLKAYEAGIQNEERFQKLAV